MSASGEAGAVPVLSPKAPAFYEVGTLRYTQSALFVLFFWLMWNDFSIMFLEQLNSLTGFLLKDLGASYTEIATIGTFGIIGLWINPVFSVWSDRHRGPLGRRRPFLFATTPFFALFLMAVPFMPDFYHYLMRFPAVAAVLNRIPVSGPILFISVDLVVMGLFNSMVLTIFSYLYWDVVPEIVLGRFSALSKIATALAGFIWSYFFFGYAEHHMKGVFVGVSVFCLVIYLTSVWQIREGEYPPPDEHRKGGIVAPIRAYFVECYSQSYFLWIFAAFTLIQIGNFGNDYRSYYLHYDLKLNLDEIGKATAIPQILIMALGFGVGSFADKLKPVTLMGPGIFLWALTNLGGYFFVTGQTSYLIWGIVSGLMVFIQGVLYGALLPEIYPREKLGQFCSACATMQAVIGAPFRPLCGMFFDAVHNNRLCFLWSAGFELLGALLFIKIYFDWRARKGEPPVPHGG